MSAPAQAAGSSCEIDLRIAGMSCAACQAHVQRALDNVPGVLEASVDLLGHQAHITATPNVDRGTLQNAVRRAGYDVLDTPAVASTASAVSGPAASTAAQGEPGHHRLGLRALLALLAGALAMVLSMPLMGRTQAGMGAAQGDHLPGTLMRATMSLMPSFLLELPLPVLCWALFCLALATMLFAAPEIYRAAWRAARHRTTNMNTLVALGTLVAFGASTYATVTLSFSTPNRNFHDIYFEAVVFILAFLLTGRWLEARARDRATSSLRQLAHTETADVRWISESSPETLGIDPAALLTAPETLLPLDAVAVGDLLRVLPGDRVPLDGIVLGGRSAVDESMLTGEPLPVTRTAGDKLYSGTLNLDGPLLLRATALGADSMQAQMTRLLERARSTRAPLQRVADRVSAIFVPTVLALAALTFTVWAIVDQRGPQVLGYGRALSFAVAVLVVACPCAMGLAVPAAVAVSLGAAARAGILIKGGEALERLATVDLVAFDKTGTLTEGKPEIVAFIPCPSSGPTPPAGHNPVETRATQQPSGLDTTTLLGYAAAVEATSTHPLAAAIRSYAGERKIPAFAASDARVLPGQGAEATLQGEHVQLGNASLLPEGIEVPEVPHELGHATPAYLLINGELQGTFYATDVPRPSAVSALQQLGKLGLQTALLTGDTLEAATPIAQPLHITQVIAKLLPAEKLSVIGNQHAQHHRVAMVGDGLNDAAALAHADAGIAMASGTDLAREAGHVLLLHHDLTLVPQAIRLARRTRRLMRQNLGWALLYNVLGIPLAAGVLTPHFGLALSPAFASAAMALSSVSVLLNSLRLARPLR